jgi:hypothetical protein
MEGDLRFMLIGRLPFIKQLRSSSIEHKFRSSFVYKTNWGRLPFRKKLGRLQLSKMLKLSSICQNIEVVFHLLSSFSLVFPYNLCLKCLTHLKHPGFLSLSPSPSLGNPGSIILWFLPSSAQAPAQLSWGWVSLIFIWSSHPHPT